MNLEVKRKLYRNKHNAIYTIYIHEYHIEVEPKKHVYRSMEEYALQVPFICEKSYLIQNRMVIFRPKLERCLIIHMDKNSIIL